VLVVLGIVVGLLAFVVILIWPAAPLWERLGLTPFCIQGSWPHLEIVSCPSAAASPAVTVGSLRTPTGESPVPVIFDDDGSPDGTIALLYFLSHPLLDVRAVTISCGEAHPEVFAPHIRGLLAELGRAEIPVGVGRGTPLEGNNAFPEPWRQASDSFWGITVPEVAELPEPTSAAELIVETVNDSSQPVMIFVSGNHTNLAEALRLDPGIMENIREVHIMGGSIHVPGNIHRDWPEIDNTVAEWNIWVDPVAADEVFTSGVEIYLTPLDATDQVLWTEQDATRWASSGSAEGAMAADLLQWMLESWSGEGVYIWDLVAAVNASEPELCAEDPLSVEVLVAPGPDQGRTVTTGDSQNANVCFDPDPEQIRASATAIFGR
jgi:purine nucleosidase/pyrimidine-specific ribonucleoside hydrolase